MPSRPNRKGSAGRGDVFVVDEDTDLLDPTLHSGGQLNPQWKPPKQGAKGSQEGKPELSSKHLEDNVTTDKKTDLGGRTSTLFPGKPSDDIIDDLNTGSVPKKPLVRFPVAMITPAPMSPGSNKV